MNVNFGNSYSRLCYNVIRFYLLDKNTGRDSEISNLSTPRKIDTHGRKLPVNDKMTHHDLGTKLSDTFSSTNLHRQSRGTDQIF